MSMLIRAKVGDRIYWHEDRDIWDAKFEVMSEPRIEKDEEGKKYVVLMAKYIEGDMDSWDPALGDPRLEDDEYEWGEKDNLIAELWFGFGETLGLELVGEGGVDFDQGGEAK